MSWWKPAWQVLDQTLRGLSEALKAKLRFFRFLRGLLTVGIVVTYVSLVAGLLFPEHLRFALAGAGIGLSLALIYLHVIVSMPLKARSVVRLIDQGYPQNAKELAIRAAARKLHDESIETEELLVETAWNEGKKAYRKYKERAERLRQEMDEEAPANLKD